MVKKIGHNSKLDKRIIEKELLKGIISENDLKEYLSQLPDLSYNVEKVVIDDNKTDQT